jgi:hypothetical protein
MEKFSTATQENAPAARKSTVDVSPTSASYAGHIETNGADKSSMLRVAGEVKLRGQLWILLVDDAGATRLENPAAFVGQGTMMVGTVEGKKVATWTGGGSRSLSIAGGQK